MMALANVTLAGCISQTEQGGQVPPAAREDVWLGVETRLLSEDLVSMSVSMGGEATREKLVNYADCAVSQYAAIRGFGFARHIRTIYAHEAGIHRADAVYTVSKAAPEGLKTIDAEVTLASCKARGIPTI